METPVDIIRRTSSVLTRPGLASDSEDGPGQGPVTAKSPVRRQFHVNYAGAPYPAAHPCPVCQCLTDSESLGRVTPGSDGERDSET